MRSAFLHGDVVTASARFRADLLVVDGVIAAIGDSAEWDLADTEIVDATDCLLLPGGIDTHTHLEHRVASGHTRTADDFESGTIAAACGGTTSIIDFVRAPAGVGIYDAFIERRARADEASAVDFSFHPIVPPTAADDDSFDQLVRLAREEGVASWKFFMAYPGSMVTDDVLLRGFALGREEGVLPIVHAENGHLVADAIQQLVSTDDVAEHRHLAAHPAIAEEEAVNRAVLLAERVGSDVFIVHVSAGAAAREVARHRARGARVFAETCPQYLTVAYEDYRDLGFPAVGYICSPPIRERSNQADLWDAIERGVIDTIGTDHAAFTLEHQDDLPPQKASGRGNFTAAPNGVPGIEERLMVMWEAGVASGRLSPERFVEITATAPARLFGLEGRKGALVPGADADILVWDPAAARTLGVATAHSRSDYSVYEGMTVSGSPRLVFSRGELIAENGEPVDGIAGRGTYLRRKREALPALPITERKGN
ncbi:dihydropyrimidinase [Agromyces atrinae]|uniref:dihydropyrimidinase n=1 Tax=Agromyces atrinae TaxID=592376 RepID=UPI001F56A7F2|nr:dihydropyrimidinase [Agromyces atrinae]MCI2956568.1 dihydropyrimidinase [Agromyces atrinae]